MFGRIPTLPYSPEKTNQLTENPLDRIERINKKREIVMKRRREKQKTEIKETKKDNKVQEGDVVFFKNFKRKNKLDPKYIKPFLVQSKTDVGSALLTDANNTKTIVANEKNMKKLLRSKKFEQYMCTHNFEKEKTSNCDEKDKLKEKRKKTIFNIQKKPNHQLLI
ncbi:hypothetical protein GVAV_002437 [Gurleya vavrai]